MFISLQLPFVDLRRFLKDPPEFVKSRLSIPTPSHGVDFKRVVNKKKFVRCFGSYRLRGYVPDFEADDEHNSSPPPGEEQWGYVKDLWQDEYMYVSTRRGLRFEQLEKQELLGGKLFNPRAKVRALRLSPFDPTNSLWSPCTRIETGILYSSESLDGGELVKALGEFLKLTVCVPVYERDGAGRTASVTHKMRNSPLIDQQQTLAKLIVNATTAQNVLKVHPDMVYAGEPLLTVHYYPDELTKLPENSIALPGALTRNVKIAYHPLKYPQMGVWLFELPSRWIRRKTAAKRLEIIRNNTIAILRYWSELQAILSLRSAIVNDEFAFSEKDNALLSDYVNRTTKFLFSNDWHGAQLEIIRNIMNAYRLAIPDSQVDSHKALKNFSWQIAGKLLAVPGGPPKIFVSYSHADKDFLQTIQRAFSTFLKGGQMGYFDDTYLNVGDEWEPEILNSIDRASVAVLLVSERFLQSWYIKEKEVPRIIERYQRGKLSIFPILVSGDIPHQGFLSSIQFLNPQQPLSTSQEHTEEIMKSLVDKISRFSS